MTKMNEMSMHGYFNPDKSNATRVMVNMSMQKDRYYKPNDLIPKRPAGRGRPPNEEPRDAARTQRDDLVGPDGSVRASNARQARRPIVDIPLYQFGRSPSKTGTGAGGGEAYSGNVIIGTEVNPRMIRRFGSRSKSARITDLRSVSAASKREKRTYMGHREWRC